LYYDKRTWLTVLVANLQNREVRGYWGSSSSSFQPLLHGSKLWYLLPNHHPQLDPETHILEIFKLHLGILGAWQLTIKVSENRSSVIIRYETKLATNGFIFTSNGRFSGPYFFSVAAIALLNGEGSREGEWVEPFFGVLRNWKYLLIKFLPIQNCIKFYIISQIPGPFVQIRTIIT
jgi:hypothetical protein